VLDALRSQRWSGNVRELRNVVETAVAMGDIHLPRDESPPPAPGEVPSPVRAYKEARAEQLAAFERRYLEELMAQYGGDLSEASRRARMDRGYLSSLLRRHRLR
jgi:DNA-binding NtrC family response regulator